MKLSKAERWAFARSEPDTNRGCWLWTRYIAPHGYGKAKHLGRSWLAHRVSYRLFHGEPGRLLVCHHCDTPACINPAHLYLGTEDENMRDSVARGRRAGRYGPVRRLTPEAVQDIRRNCRAGRRGAGVKAFARKYGVNPATIRYHVRQAALREAA